MRKYPNVNTLEKYGNEQRESGKQGKHNEETREDKL